MSRKETDVLIVGAGPVGMYTAFYCGLRNMKVTLVDSLGQLGGQVSALYPEKDINDLPGFPRIKAKDFIANLKAQMDEVEGFIDVALNENIVKIDKVADREFVISSESGNEYEAKAVIVTAGGGAFSPRLMGVEDEEKYDNIHYFVDNLQQFADRKVAIFGGGDSAVDWALMLEPIAKEVSIVHRRKAFRAKEANVDALNASTVNVLTPFSPAFITGEGKTATSITITETKSKEDTTIEVDDIIVNFGFLSSLGPIEEWNLEIDSKKLVVDRMQQTNIEGIFACGDICTYENREVQITTGLGEGLTASAAVQRYAFPDLKARPIR